MSTSMKVWWLFLPLLTSWICMFFINQIGLESFLWLIPVLIAQFKMHLIAWDAVMP